MSTGPSETSGRTLTGRGALAFAGAASTLGGAAFLAAGAWLDRQGLIKVGVLLAVLGVIWLVCARFGTHEPMREVDRRYLREFFPAMIAYVLVLLLTLPLVDRVQSSSLRIAIALLPMLPTAFVVRAIVRRVRHGDELERLMHLEATAIASLLVGMASFSAGFLEAAGVFHLEGGLLLVFPALLGAWGLALWWTRRRFRGE